MKSNVRLWGKGMVKFVKFRETVYLGLFQVFKTSVVENVSQVRETKIIASRYRQFVSYSKTLENTVLRKVI